jgi:hypothetical protein
LVTKIFKELLSRINQLFPIEGVKWIASDQWDKLPSREKLKSAAVNSRCTQLKYWIADQHVVFCTMKKNENNCVVALKPNLKASYGIINEIFQHSRVTPSNVALTDTWVAIRPLIPVPLKGDPFAQFSDYSIYLSLRRIDHSNIFVFHISEILAHCAWMEYKPGEAISGITENCIALVCLDRS